MRTQRNSAWLAVCAFAGIVSASGAAFAQITSKYLGQSVVVENKPGAGGMLGPGTTAKTAKADGYTVSQLPVGAFRIPHMQKVDWGPLRDFTYIIGSRPSARPSSVSAC